MTENSNNYSQEESPIVLGQLQSQLFSLVMMVTLSDHHSRAWHFSATNDLLVAIFGTVVIPLISVNEKV